MLLVLFVIFFPNNLNYLALLELSSDAFCLNKDYSVKSSERTQDSICSETILCNLLNCEHCEHSFSASTGYITLYHPHMHIEASTSLPQSSPSLIRTVSHHFPVSSDYILAPILSE